MAPKNEKNNTTPEMAMGRKSMGLREEAALFLDEPDELEAALVETAETDPEPAVAVPGDVSPAFWDPAPVRPGPVPAPLFIMAAAFSGMAGRESSETSQLSDWAGQALAPPVALYPPSPVGLACAAKAVCRAVKSGPSVTSLPEMVTRPYLLPSSEYS